VLLDQHVERQIEHVEADVPPEEGIADAERSAVEVGEHDVPLAVRRDASEYADDGGGKKDPAPDGPWESDGNRHHEPAYESEVLPAPQDGLQVHESHDEKGRASQQGEGHPGRQHFREHGQESDFPEP
jgi:hypothetical protein